MISAVSAGWFDFLDDSPRYVENNETNLVVGFNSEFPPFGYEDENGNYTGFDLELAQEVCKRNNWTFEPHPIIDWVSKDAELNSRAIDCIWSEFTINGREDDFEWTKPYFNNTPVFVVKNSSDIYSLEDLKGKAVEVEMSTAAVDSLNNENKTLKDSFKSLTEVKDYNTAFMDLESGICEAILCDKGIAKYQMVENYSDGDYRILETPLSYEQYGVGFKKGNTELRNQVQETLNEMYEDGTVDKIAQKYEAYDIPEGIIYP